MCHVSTVVLRFELSQTRTMKTNNLRSWNVGTIFQDRQTCRHDFWRSLIVNQAGLALLDSTKLSLQIFQSGLLVVFYQLSTASDR